MGDENKSFTIEFNREKLTLLVLSAVFVMLAVQSFFLAGSLNVLKEQTLAVSQISAGSSVTASPQTAANAAGTNAGSTAIPQNLQNLPSQVGGC